MNQLYKDIDAATDEFGVELWIGQQLGKISGLTLNGAYTGPLVAAYRNPTESLIQDGTADVIVVNDYEYTSLWGQPSATRYFEGRNITAAATQEDVFAWAENHFGDPIDTRLFLWAPISTTKLNDELPFWTAAVTDFHFDGVLLHEAINFELGVGNTYPSGEGGFGPLMELSQSFNQAVSVGRLDGGIAVGDFESGTGYVLHSTESVHTHTIRREFDWCGEQQPSDCRAVSERSVVVQQQPDMGFFRTAGHRSAVGND
jgi:hypothetical protein